VAVFKQLDAIVDLARVDDILNRSMPTNHFGFEEYNVLRHFTNTLHRLAHHYLDPVLRRRAEQLAGEMNELLAVVGQTCWVGSDGALTFRPDPTDPVVSEAAWKQLHENRAQAWETYQAYQRVVNERLMV
jgi:hypothetical protein